MAVSVSVLASGSRGNSVVVQTSRTRILVDAGISCRETFKRMRAGGDDPYSLTAIVITHEHSDHVAGLAVLARKLKIPVFMTGATHQAWSRAIRDEKSERPDVPKIGFFSAGRKFVIGDVEVMPFTIPHDAADPVGFTFRCEGVKAAVATDLGFMPPNVCDQLRGCDILVIESNHDVEMLRVGPYPWSVKQRVMSRVGHLSNTGLAQFFAANYDGSASYIVLAHISEQNNHPELALQEAKAALSVRPTLWQNRVMLAAQTGPLDPIRL